MSVRECLHRVKGAWNNPRSGLPNRKPRAEARRAETRGL